jgi:ABC-2 type transport system permease protein
VRLLQRSVLRRSLSSCAAARRYDRLVTTYAAARPTERSKRSAVGAYWHSLWLLTRRDLRVRYATNVLGYVWSVLDPLLMAGIYFLVFVVIFKRDPLDERPYIVFLLSGMLPWTWFNGAVSDFTKAFRQEAKLIRSTAIPRTIWINRIILSKGIEYLYSLPVLAFFVIVFRAHIHWQLALMPLAVLIQTALLVGLGLMIAPAVMFFKDLERAVKLILRLLFYVSAVLYSAHMVPRHTVAGYLFDLNPLVGLFGLYHSAFFPADLNWALVGVSALGAVAALLLGWWVYSRSIRNVLKEM